MKRILFVLVLLIGFACLNPFSVLRDRWPASPSVSAPVATREPVVIYVVPTAAPNGSVPVPTALPVNPTVKPTAAPTAQPQPTNTQNAKPAGYNG